MIEREIIIVHAPGNSPMLNGMVEAFHSGEPHRIIDLDDSSENVLSKLPVSFSGCLLTFAIGLDPWGTNFQVQKFIIGAYNENHEIFENAVIAFLLYSESELYTKSYISNLTFTLNTMGAIIPGHPLVEAIPHFQNFKTWQKTMQLDKREICHLQCSRLRERLSSFILQKFEHPKILVLHASNENSSNTFALWKMVKSYLKNVEIKEIHVENGSIMDCHGCGFKKCQHFGNQQRCFYGGVMVDSIYPEVEKADAVVWLSPNYNDSVSANLIAVINRLTALYRVTPFYNKYSYSIIVSGNSGGDSVTKQLMNALCINKGFNLDKRSYITATANDPGAIYQIKDIERKAEAFANNIMNMISI